MQVKWETEDNPEKYLSQFVNEVRKQTVIYDINIDETHWHRDDCNDVLQSATSPSDIDIVIWCSYNAS